MLILLFNFLINCNLFLLEPLWTGKMPLNVSRRVTDDFPPNPVYKKGWELTMHDEFNDKKFNESLWIPYYFKHRFKENESRTNFVIDSGLLTLKIDSGKFQISSLQTIENNSLISRPLQSVVSEEKFAQKYGYFEIRAKTQGGSGHHCAFWMIGISNDSTQTAEIDIMEHAGNMGNKSFQVNFHNWSDTRKYSVKSSQNLSDPFRMKVLQERDLTSTFNIYAVEWNKSEIKYYFNNKLIHVVIGAPNYKMGVLLSLYQGAGWTGKVDKLVKFPKTFKIDYFRAYRRV